VNLVIVLVDAELELAPGPGEGCVPILDAYCHRDVMRSLPGASRRGRPDIVHTTLLLCQGSELNRQGRLRTYVHTRDDKVIEVGRDTDVHPNYIRFLQEMGSLLQGKEVPGYAISDIDLRTLVRRIGADLRVALSPSGDNVSLAQVFEDAGDGTVLAMIGAFPEGDFVSPVYELADVKISLGPELMRVPEVTSKVLRAVPEKK
jgi:rRNA small subunit pseudouridine methyltransferase Nep1